MAGITLRLKVNSNDATDDKLKLNIKNDITVGEPLQQISSISVAADAATSLVPTTATDTYVYIKNTDSSNFIQVRRILDKGSGGGDEAGPYDFAKLLPGHFCYFCVYEGLGLEVIANQVLNTPCVIQYGIWTKA